MDSEDLCHDMPVKISDPFLSRNIQVPPELPYLDKKGRKITPPNNNVPKRSKKLNWPSLVTRHWNYFEYRRRHRCQSTMSRLRSLNANRGDKTIYPRGMTPSRSRNYSISIGKNEFSQNNDTISLSNTASTTVDSLASLGTKQLARIPLPSKPSNKPLSSFEPLRDIEDVKSTSFLSQSSTLNKNEATRRHSSNVNPAIMLNDKPTILIDEENETRLRRHSSTSAAYTVSQHVSFV